ncbi:isoeugenol synthase 1-like isoform X2 [Diospyros lotus]|uniref:isoeugenol synthase 1-like isoform X2 n=1 Tax=Diospyros lotus TaxID=55363 RepID=UPI00225AF4DC|nr:isoeugenol synthase 1-like isoform X2 [Diospyros lotus]
MDGEKSKILIFGATGYLGQFMVKASVSMGHPTFAYVRPINPSSDDPSKLLLHRHFQSIGVTIFQGELEEEEKLVWVLRQVDVVISTLAVPQHLHQLKLITAMKRAANIKRFVPSEFGSDVDRVRGLPPFQALLDNKKKVRRATEAAGLSYTYVSANSFSAYFIDFLLHSHDKSDQVTIYGSGEAKDVAAYTVKASTDERTANRVIYCRPPGNVVSQLNLLSSWEHKTGRTFTKGHLPEQDIIDLSRTLPAPENIKMAILYNVFVEGAETSFELGEEELEASRLYPDYDYTSVDKLLDICLLSPPKPKLSTFT